MAAEYRLHRMRPEGKTALVTGGAGTGRFARPSSEDAFYVTGQTLNLSGVLSMW
jgi:hypothetical protein